MLRRQAAALVVLFLGPLAFALEVGPTGSKAEAKPPVVADEGLKAIEIDAPATLTESNAKYVLTKDVVAPGTAFTVGAGVKNCILDLGGHVVTYNADKQDVVPGKPYDECVFGVAVTGRGIENILIRNGTIVQGEGGNAGSHAVSLRGGKAIEIANLQLRVHGPSTSGISVAWGGPDGRIHDNYIENRSRTLREGLFSPDGIILSQTAPNWQIYNNTIIGGHTAVAVWANAASDHNSNCDIHHNLLSPLRVHGVKAPQGVMCFGAAGNRIYENQISSDDARGINLQGMNSGNNDVHHNIIACRYSTKATEGNYVENRCYGYWERNGQGNRLHENLWIVGNEVTGDPTSNSIGIVATTTGGRLPSAEFRNNRLIVRHSDPTCEAIGFEIKRSDKDVVVEGNEIIARVAAANVIDDSRGVQVRGNTWLRTAKEAADAPVVSGDSAAQCEQKDNETAVLADDGKAPAAPAGFHALNRFEAIELRWKRDLSPNTLGYVVYCDGKRITPYAVGGGFWVHTGLKPGEKHQYEVSAVDLWDREGPKCLPVEVTVP